MIRTLADRSMVDKALGSSRALLYKHSPICWQSALALRQVRRFVELHPDTPVYVVDVVAQADLSDLIARRLQVGHASPQAILLQGGTATWSASHLGIRAKALSLALGGQ